VGGSLSLQKNRICLVLFKMNNRKFGAYLAAKDRILASVMPRIATADELNQTPQCRKVHLSDSRSMSYCIYLTADLSHRRHTWSLARCRSMSHCICLAADLSSQNTYLELGLLQTARYRRIAVRKAPSILPKREVELRLPPKSGAIEDRAPCPSKTRQNW
jgi:hypothetical protein